MRIAIIGGGSIGSRHARNAQTLGHEVIVYDIDPTKGRSLWAFNCDGVTHTSYTDGLHEIHAFSEVPDAVMICTPAATHAAVAKQIADLDYRGPLFVEKPICTSSTEAEIFRTWPHPVTMVGYNWLWNRELDRFLRAAVEADSHVDLFCYTNMSDWPGSSYGDPVLECSHEIAVAFHVLGGTARPLGSGVDRDRHFAFFLLTNDSGLKVTVTVEWGSNTEVRSFEVWSAARSWWRWTPSKQSLEDSYLLEIDDFARAVEKQQCTPCSFVDGLRVLDICEQARPCVNV